MLDAAAQGCTFAWQRLTSERPPLAPAMAVAFVAVVGWLEAGADASVATDRTLTGAALGLALPLTVLALVGRLAPSERLDQALLPVSRRGVDRREAVLGVLGVLVLVAATCGTLIASITVLATRGLADPRFIADLGTSAWIGALGGSVYAAWFGLGACMGARGGGRWVLFFLDAILGVGTTALAAPWPRAHLRNLLGADAVLALPQWSAAPCLVALFALAMVATWRRTDP